MEPWEKEIDHRSRMFLGLTRENLAMAAAAWPRTEATPDRVKELLSEARRLWVGAADSYDNFVASSLKSLHAAELALRLRLGVKDGDRATFGQLFTERDVFRVLDRDLGRYLWFHKFALHFRNELSHPKQSKAFFPGVAEGFLRSSHEQVGMLYPGPST